MKSQSHTKPIHMQKKPSKSMKGQRRALELQEGGGCSAASAQHAHAARRAVSALQIRLLLAKCFQILTSSEAASALAVAVSAKALAASGKLLPAVKAALACFDAVPTSHFEAALHT